MANLPALLHLPDLAPIWTPTYRAISFGERSVPLLELEGYDTVNQRGMYSLVLPARSPWTKAAICSSACGTRFEARSDAGPILGSRSLLSCT